MYTGQFYITLLLYQPGLFPPERMLLALKRNPEDIGFLTIAFSSEVFLLGSECMNHVIHSSFQLAMRLFQRSILYS